MWPKGLFVSALIFCSKIGDGWAFFARWQVRLVRPLVASLPAHATHPHAVAVKETTRGDRTQCVLR